MTDDVIQMQQEAARRVQRMQAHSRQVAQEHRGRTPETLAAARTPGWPGPPPEELRSPGLYIRPAEDTAIPQAEPTAAPVVTLPLLEGEQWLLLGLALLLFRSGCRVELLLALLYLAM